VIIVSLLVELEELDLLVFSDGVIGAGGGVGAGVVNGTGTGTGVVLLG
jgi:hypothetical protein